MVLNSQLLAKVLEHIVVELLAIVRDKDLRDSEMANDALPNEALNISLCDSGQWFYFNPFGEVVDPYDEELELSHSDRERSHYIQPSLGVQPKGAHWCKFLRWSSYDVAKALALVTRPYVGLDIFLHSGPIVVSPYHLVNQ